MVVSSSKKILCVVCNKKCTGNVLRYQDQYYHKQCFELDSRQDTISSSTVSRTPTPSGNVLNSRTLNVAPQQRSSSGEENSSSTTNRDEYLMRQTLPRTSTPQNVAASYPKQNATCAGCRNKIQDGQALVALDLHWHIWCFKCTLCQQALHGEYVAKDGKAYCEKDYQKLFGVVCVYCKRYITGKVLQAGEAHHFHPSCARCSKCGDPFVPGEEMYLQGEVTWHPRCGPGPDQQSTLGDDQNTVIHNDSSNRSQLHASRPRSPSLSSRSRSASPFSYMSRQYGRTSPGYTDSEAVGDLSRVYTISYLNADPTQGYLRRPVEPNPPKSPQFSRPTSAINRDNRSRSSSRSQYYTSTGSGIHRDRSVPRGMYSVLSSMRSGSSVRARSPSMMNEEAIHLAQYPSGQKPSPDAVPKIERDDFPAPPFPYPEKSHRRGQTTAANGVTSQSKSINKSSVETNGEPVAESRKGQQQQRSSRPRSREIVIDDGDDDDSNEDPQLKKEEEELSKIASGIGKIFLQTLKEREKLRAWKRSNLDPRNASRTPSATRELPSRLRYDNPLNASPSRDMDRPRPWEEEDADNSPTRTKSSLGKPSQMSSSTYGYKVVQSNRSTPKPGYGLSTNGLSTLGNNNLDQAYTLPSNLRASESMSFIQHQRGTQNRSTDLLSRTLPPQYQPNMQHHHLPPQQLQQSTDSSSNQVKSRSGTASSVFSSPNLRRSMPNVNSLHHLHQEGPPKLYPYHLLATSNYRLPPGVDRCHLERHLSNEEFQYIFHCDRLDFYRLPEWKRNELKRRAKLF